MFFFGDDEEPEVKPLYSRSEEYSLYKGMEKYISKPYQYEYYSKMYLRADLKRTIIKRNYQKFMEFYADASSLLIAIYEILIVIFNYINTFYWDNEVSKRMFFFKDVENSENFNVVKSNIIKELIAITDLKKTSENTHYKDESKEAKNVKNFPPKKNQVSEEKEEQKDIKIYNNTKKSLEKKQSNTSSYKKGKDTNERIINNYSEKKNIAKKNILKNIPNIKKIKILEEAKIVMLYWILDIMINPNMI